MFIPHRISSPNRQSIKTLLNTEHPSSFDGHLIDATESSNGRAEWLV